jgi:hypothetical protein
MGRLFLVVPDLTGVIDYVYGTNPNMVLHEVRAPVPRLVPPSPLPRLRQGNHDAIDTAQEA